MNSSCRAALAAGCGSFPGRPGGSEGPRDENGLACGPAGLSQLCLDGSVVARGTEGSLDLLKQFELGQDNLSDRVPA